jgi:hypothetical protein
MTTAEINTTIVDGYVGLLDNLSTNNKLDLISKLTASVKADLNDKKSSFKKLLVHLTQQNLPKKLLKKSVTAEFLADKSNRF